MIVLRLGEVIGSTSTEDGEESVDIAHKVKF